MNAQTVIVVDPAATSTEAYAARQLADYLGQITGGSPGVRTNSFAPPQAIIVGIGAASHAQFPDLKLNQFGSEEIIIRSKGDRLLLAGGRPRGTLYAVSRFLQDQCDVRWWTPWASRVPQRQAIPIHRLNVRAKPAFEYRVPFWFDAFDADWSWRNFCNGEFSHLPEDKGGCVVYKGFVHTAYKLVPPEENFAAHPEWFALVDGHRTNDNAQLCLSNPQLRQFAANRVKQWLRESPGAQIVSVSQNDCAGWCQCSNCAALDAAQGSHSGSALDFVNYIADQIAPEFPNVAVDTLAYQYTRHPPRSLRPRTNVIVRLCSIECNFRQPLEAPTPRRGIESLDPARRANAQFTDDLHGWAACADRLYIWDYVTDFAHYVQPHPNWFALGRNLRLFQANHVRGVFEEGAYQSHGSEMAELRAWVLAQLLWNPKQDDRALIRQFLEGYYGPAAPFIERYMKETYRASSDWKLTCYSRTDAPFLKFKPLSESEKLWQQAERSVASDPEFLARVRVGHLAARYVWLSQWNSLRAECAAAHARWPLPESRDDVAAEFRSVASGAPGKPWSAVSILNEGGQTVDQFLSR